MNPPIRSYFASLTLALWGTAFLYFFFSGRIASYLHPIFHLPVVLSGIILLCLAAILFAFPTPDESCSPDCSTLHPKPQKTHFLVWLILTLPLCIATISSPSQFTSSTILNRGIVDSADLLPTKKKPSSSQGMPVFPWLNDPSMDAASYLAQTPEGLIRAETIDLLFAAQEPQLRPDFENKQIEIIGQYLPEKTPLAPADRFQLLRLFVMCCAADARPIGVSVQGKIPEPLPEMAWIKVKGIATFPKINARIYPVIQASSIEPCPPPQETFLY